MNDNISMSDKGKKLLDQANKHEIEPSLHISEKEEKLLAFCKQQGLQITFAKNNNNERFYSVKVEMEYLDNVEKKVVEFCIANDIKYEYYRSIDGMHHYNFPKGMVDMLYPESSVNWNEEIQGSVSHPGVGGLGGFMIPIGEQVEYLENPEVIEPKKNLWKKICEFFGYEHKETEEECSDRENLEFINHLGYRTQDELLKLGIPEPIRYNNRIH